MATCTLGNIICVWETLAVEQERRAVLANQVVTIKELILYFVNANVIHLCRIFLKTLVMALKST